MPPSSGLFCLGQHDQRTRQFIGGECVSRGGDNQFAELPHLAGFQPARLVFERFELRVKVPWLAHHILRKLSMER
jgi:hypothetical protein